MIHVQNIDQTVGASYIHVSISTLSKKTATLKKRFCYTLRYFWYFLVESDRVFIFDSSSAM